jgi:hypothetical protein
MLDLSPVALDSSPVALDRWQVALDIGSSVSSSW